MDKPPLKRLLFGKNFKETIEDMRKIDFSMPLSSSSTQFNMQDFTFFQEGELVSNIEEGGVHEINPKEGLEFIKNQKITAYDESVKKHEALEGKGFLTSHSLVVLGQEDYIPLNLLTLYFYTRSNDLCSKGENIKYSEDPEMDSKKDFADDKLDFLLNNTPEGSILLIDGPLIAGDVYTKVINKIRKFHEKEIIPVFFVKNSNSNLVIGNDSNLGRKFNSDMHWSFNILKKGQRTDLFGYSDKRNYQNSKVFFYFKPFNISPQRIEFHRETFEKHKEVVPDLINALYYLILVQGRESDPQIRPIKVAEMFARETLKMFDLNKLMKDVGITSTINQERFAW